MDRNQEQVLAKICLFLELERFGINFSLTGTGIAKSQINFVHESFLQLVAQFSSNSFAVCANNLFSNYRTNFKYF